MLNWMLSCFATMNKKNDLDKVMDKRVGKVGDAVHPGLHYRNNIAWIIQILFPPS